MECQGCGGRTVWVDVRVTECTVCGLLRVYPPPPGVLPGDL